MAWAHKTKILSVGFILLVFGITTNFSFESTFAESEDTVYTGDQTTLSGNLENNSVAQDILKKIEMTKKWIAELEEKNYEMLASQRELNEKREQVLKILMQDLEEWEKLWEEYSPRNAYTKFVEKQPEYVQGVFWEQFNFTERKAAAGLEAFDKVRFEGGSFLDARQAYYNAAESKYMEIIKVNSEFNVKHNQASDELQDLFDNSGKFIRTPENRGELRSLYGNYLTNPEYLEANPDEVERSQDECRKGYVMIFLQQRYSSFCTPISTAEMYVENRMGYVKNWPSE